MDLLYALLLCPIFFILLYAVNEYWLPTRNGAMIVSLCISIVFSIIYYIIKKELRQYHKRRAKENKSRQDLKTGLMLLSDESFASLFEYPYVVADNSFEGLKEEKLLQVLRQCGCDKKYDFFLLNGMKPGCKDLLAILNVSYILHTEEEILSAAENARIPDHDSGELPEKSKIFTVIKSKAFAKFGIKYGVTLLLISLITPYKTFYSVFGALLLGYGILLFAIKLYKKINQQSRIPNR